MLIDTYLLYIPLRLSRLSISMHQLADNLHQKRLELSEYQIVSLPHTSSPNSQRASDPYAFPALIIQGLSSSQPRPQPQKADPGLHPIRKYDIRENAISHDNELARLQMRKVSADGAGARVRRFERAVPEDRDAEMM
jgi:hypothetical protein